MKLLAVSLLLHCSPNTDGNKKTASGRFDRYAFPGRFLPSPSDSLQSALVLSRVGFVNFTNNPDGRSRFHRARSPAQDRPYKTIGSKVGGHVSQSSIPIWKQNHACTRRRSETLSICRIVTSQATIKGTQSIVIRVEYEYLSAIRLSLAYDEHGPRTYGRDT
jgi:hypothetical protein